MVTQIATAATQQSATAELVDANIGNIAEMTTQTSVNAAETAKSCIDLSNLAFNMQTVVGNFKLTLQAPAHAPATGSNALPGAHAPAAGSNALPGAHAPAAGSNALPAIQLTNRNAPAHGSNPDSASPSHLHPSSAARPKRDSHSSLSMLQ
jgi:hypothetical protein